MDVIKAMRFFMQQHGMSQQDLSREAHLNPATISLIMTDKRLPSMATLIAISDCFGVKVSEFIAAGE